MLWPGIFSFKEKGAQLRDAKYLKKKKKKWDVECDCMYVENLETFGTFLL